MNDQPRNFLVTVPIPGNSEICLCRCSTAEAASAVVASLLKAEVNRPDWVRVEAVPALPGT